MTSNSPSGGDACSSLATRWASVLEATGFGSTTIFAPSRFSISRKAAMYFFCRPSASKSLPGQLHHPSGSSAKLLDGGIEEDAANRRPFLCFDRVSRRHCLAPPRLAQVIPPAAAPMDARNTRRSIPLSQPQLHVEDSIRRLMTWASGDRRGEVNAGMRPSRLRPGPRYGLDYRIYFDSELSVRVRAKNFSIAG